MSEAEFKDEEYVDPFEGKTIEDIARMYLAARDRLDEAKAESTRLQKWFDQIRLHAIPDKMEELGASSINLKGIGRVTVTGDMYAGIVKGMQPQAYSWLIENGHADLIKDFVHSSTMKAFLKEQTKLGEELPLEFFKIDPFTRGSITKK